MNTTETKAQHTPGPWRTGEEHKGAISIYGRSVDPFDDRPMTDRDTFLCAVRAGRWTYEQAANARLIAAAPELLNRLTDCADDIDAAIKRVELEGGRIMAGWITDARETLKQARAAIAKATL